MSRVWLEDRAHVVPAFVETLPAEAPLERDDLFRVDEPATDALPAVEPFDPALLPSHPLRLRPSRWAPVLRWAVDTAQLALGATLGSAATLVGLYWLIQLAR